MKIFGKRRKWYLTKFAKFQYRVGRGDGLTNFVVGKFKTLFMTIVTLGTGEVVVEAWWGISILEHIPWWIIVLLPIVALISDYTIGWLDEKKLNLMQIEAEIKNRRKLDPWEAEKMERIRKIERKVAPETYKKQHPTYIDGEEELELKNPDEKK